jgi:hypothetical protein
MMQEHRAELTVLIDIALYLFNSAEVSGQHGRHVQYRQLQIDDFPSAISLFMQMGDVAKSLINRRVAIDAHD